MSQEIEPTLISGRTEGAPVVLPPNSPARIIWRRFRKNPAAITGAGMLLVILAGLLVLAPWANRIYSSIPMVQDSTTVFTGVNARPPSAEHWLGTDKQGRDFLSRLVFGGQMSLTIGILAAATAVIIGATWGLVAGYAGGRTDALMMRFVDVLYGLPYILLAAILTLFKSKVSTGISDPLLGAFVDNAVLFIAIGAVSWLTMARVVRGEVLSLRAQPFVEAAVAGGIPTWRILLRHILPNLAGTIIVYATLLVPQAILQESFLSFLGLGVSPDTPTWGQLATSVTALNRVKNDWWLIVPQCVLLAVTLLSLNFLGDGLREAFDPKSGRE